MKIKYSYYIIQRYFYFVLLISNYRDIKSKKMENTPAEVFFGPKKFCFNFFLQKSDFSKIPIFQPGFFFLKSLI